MKIVGVLILALELASLAITLQQECKRNNITLRALLLKMANLKQSWITWRTQRQTKLKKR